jgi:hypothetical protein
VVWIGIVLGTGMGVGLDVGIGMENEGAAVGRSNRRPAWRVYAPPSDLRAPTRTYGGTRESQGRLRISFGRLRSHGGGAINFFLGAGKP